MSKWPGLVLACVVGFSYVLSASAQGARPPARRPAPVADPAKKKEAAERWSKEGKEALAAAAYEAARDRFQDVLEIDPRNAQAMHGVGLALVGLGETKKATGMMQGALDAEIRTAGIGKVSKPLLVNYAMVMISAREPMRAVKPLTDYQRLNVKPDEAVLNALAVALNTADGAARKQPAYAAAVRFYDDFNGKLEATRPGQKRWGVTWKSEEDFKQFSAMWQADVEEMGKLYGEVEVKARELEEMQTRHDKAQHLIDVSGVVPSTMGYIRTELARRKREFDAAVAAYQSRSERVRKPTLPVTMSAVPLDGDAAAAVASMSVTEAVAVAPTPRAPRRRPARNPNTNVPTPEPAPAPVVVVAPNQSETPAMVVPKQQGKRTVVRPAAAFAVGPDLLLTSARAVEGAKEIQVTDLNGESKKGQVVKSDANVGLALIKVEGGRMAYGQLADSFKGGTVQVVSLAPSIFQPTTEIVPGSIKVTGEDWALSLQRAPKRVGAPVVAMNKVVGVELGDRDGDLTKLSVANVEAIRQFCGAELSKSSGPFGQPGEALCELLVTSEVE